MFADKKLSLTNIVRAFWLQVSVTWTLTLLETLILVTLPLRIGQSIDGFLNDTWGPFLWLASAMSILLLPSVSRRLYDTRAYGRMRVELGAAVAAKAEMGQVSTTNARLNMSRELIGFLETEAPIVLLDLLQVSLPIERRSERAIRTAGCGARNEAQGCYRRTSFGTATARNSFVGHGSDRLWTDLCRAFIDAWHQSLVCSDATGGNTGPSLLDRDLFL